jgi:hypothetical protein
VTFNFNTFEPCRICNKDHFFAYRDKSLMKGYNFTPIPIDGSKCHDYVPKDNLVYLEWKYSERNH